MNTDRLWHCLTFLVLAAFFLRYIFCSILFYPLRNNYNLTSGTSISNSLRSSFSCCRFFNSLPFALRYWSHSSIHTLTAVRSTHTEIWTLVRFICRAGGARHRFMFGIKKTFSSAISVCKTLDPNLEMKSPGSRGHAEDEAPTIENLWEERTFERNWQKKWTRSL